MGECVAEAVHPGVDHHLLLAAVENEVRRKEHEQVEVIALRRRGVRDVALTGGRDERRLGKRWDVRRILDTCKRDRRMLTYVDVC